MQAEETLLLTAGSKDALYALSEPLLEWYGAHARTLPWRESATPYHVWISEIMLQQTRVEAVRGYYTRFIAALPDVAALAAVEEPVLLKLWEGLGYYNRARNLRRAAVVLMQQYHGMLPASYAALLELPGVGAYTAGAVASIAFGIPVPAVDGNVLRVLSRILGSYADIALPAVKDAWRELLLDVVPASRPGDFNQALMELGATVCLPNAAPQCLLCPVQQLCIGYSDGLIGDLPVKTGKKPRRVEERTIVLLRSGDGLLLFRRDSGLLAGMYEPLNLEGRLTAAEAAGAAQALGAVAHDAPVPLGAAKHIFTHVEWRMQGYLLNCAPFPAPDNAIWADAATRSECAVPSAFRAYL